MGYRLILGLLFSNLVAGVLIGEFARYEEERKTIVGEVMLAFDEVSKALQTDNIVSGQLGVAAEQLLATGDENTPQGKCSFNCDADGISSVPPTTDTSPDDHDIADYEIQRVDFTIHNQTQQNDSTITM